MLSERASLDLIWACLFFQLGEWGGGRHLSTEACECHSCSLGQVYSFLALASFYNKYYGQCSKVGRGCPWRTHSAASTVALSASTFAVPI